MKHFLIILFSLSILYCCKSKNISYMYIYDNKSESNLPIDSLLVIDSSFEKSLEYYKDKDSISKIIDGIVYFSILEIPTEIGVSNIRIEKNDINSDNYQDILIYEPTGGTAGDICYCLFYDNEKRTFKYDKNVELRNIEIFSKEKQVICSYNWSSVIYQIENSSFKKIEETKYLEYSSTNPNYENLKEITKFDTDGKIITIDTVKINNKNDFHK